MKRNAKKLVALRLCGDARKALSAMAKATGKSKTRVMEEAIILHAKEIARAA